MIGKILSILLIVFVMFVAFSVLALCKASGEADKRIRSIVHNIKEEASVCKNEE